MPPVPPPPRRLRSRRSGLGGNLICGGVWASRPRHRRGDTPARTALQRALPALSVGSAVGRAGEWRRGWASGHGAPPRPQGSTGPCCSGRVSGGKTTWPPSWGELEEGTTAALRPALASPPPGASVLLHYSAVFLFPSLLPSFTLLPFLFSPLSSFISFIPSFLPTFFLLGIYP